MKPLDQRLAGLVDRRVGDAVRHRVADLVDRWIPNRIGRSFADFGARLLASPRFRRAAIAFPPTRPIARRRASALFDLATGFVHSQILLAACRLGLPALLLETRGDARSLASALGLPEDKARRLLDASVSLRIARRRRDGTYGIGRLGASLIGQDGVLAMIEHHALLYEDLRDPVALLRGDSGETGLAGFWPYAAQAAVPPHAARAAVPTARAAAYSDLMSRSQAMVADEVLGSWRIARARAVLDVGGGDGTFLLRAAGRARRAKLILFDLPAVASLARVRFQRAGLGDRAVAVGGDFRQDDLPRGADLVTLIRVLHDHDDDTVRSLLRRARAALAPGGKLLVSEPMRETPGARAMGDAYFGFYLLAMGRGRPRSAAEHDRLLREAGFANTVLLRGRVPLLTRTIIAS